MKSHKILIAKNGQMDLLCEDGKKEAYVIAEKIKGISNDSEMVEKAKSEAKKLGLTGQTFLNAVSGACWMNGN